MSTRHPGAALTRFDRGEAITAPSLHEQPLQDYEAARARIAPLLSSNAPAPRYAVRAGAELGA